MSTTVDQMITSAEVALSRSSEEDWRVSVHQAYYAFFHHTMQLATQHLSATIEGPSQHKQLYQFMQSQKNGKFRSLGKTLRAAALLRVRADYDLDTDLGQKEARNHLKICQESLKVVEEFLVQFSEQPQS